MTFHDSSILSDAERRRRCVLLSQLASADLAALRHAEPWHLDVLAEGVLARWGYAWCPARGWRVRRSFLPLWSALRAHLRDVQAIERRLVAEVEWRMRRAA